MPDFSYTALSGAQRQSGVLTANSEREALAQLDARGLLPLKIEQKKSATEGGVRIKARTLASFYGQLADLLQSGVPLLRSMEILERQASNPALNAVLKDVRGKVAEGTGLSQAMGAHPKVFSELAVSMVLAGQEGGFLEDVLRRIADFTEHQEDMKSKVVGAMAYPMVLGGLGGVILIVLLVFFVPNSRPFLTGSRKRGRCPP